MPDPHRIPRVVRRAVGLAVAELILLGVAHLSPATAVLMRPVYVVVALVFAVAILHAARDRSGDDRRHEQRRHGP